MINQADKDLKRKVKELCEKIGLYETSRKLGIPKSKIFSWAKLKRDSGDIDAGLHGRRTYTEYEVSSALKMCEVTGVESTAAKLGISIKGLEDWIAESKLKTKKTYTYEEKQAAIERVKAVGFDAAQSELKIPRPTMYVWAKNAKVIEVNKREKRPTYGVETRIQAIELQKSIGIEKAAKELGMHPNTIANWVAKNAIEPIRVMYSDAFKRDAVVLARNTSTPRAAKELGLSSSTIRSWIKVDERKRPEEVIPKRNVSNELKLQGIKLAKEVGDASAAAHLGVKLSTIRYWKTQGNQSKRKVVSYSIAEKQHAINYALTHGVLRAGEDLNINDRTIHRWMRDVSAPSVPHTRQPKKKYSNEFIARAVEMIQQSSIAETSERLHVSTQSLVRWYKATNDPKKKIKGRQVGSDFSFSWIDDSYPQLLPWKQYAIDWLAGEPRSIGARIQGVRSFLVKFLVERNLPLIPTELLAKTTAIPDFYELCCTKSSYGITIANFAFEFIEWILLNRMSERDDYGNLTILPLFRNPLTKRSHAGIQVPSESVYTPLPYGYIDDLRKMLAPGAHFEDWKWAIDSGAGRGVAGVTMDWFEVKESEIDTEDPDCVFRRRLRGRASGGAIFEVWSPVRWVALLLKLILPLRTFQVRMLDSGEADTWQCTGKDEKTNLFSWTRNQHVLSEGTPRRPFSKGVLRRVNSSAELINLGGNTESVILYINTNKTADIYQNSSELGYTIPWVNMGGLPADAHYWILKLINWQRKYNPTDRKVKWNQLDARHRDAKSSSVLASYPDTCFLFRMPEGPSGEKDLPLSDSAINVAWYRLLSTYEDQLFKRGQKHENGTKIRLVPEKGPLNSNKTFFPLHSLRVSLITSLALEGKVPFPVLQRVVGHSRLIMTLYYTKPSYRYTSQLLAEAGEKLENSKEESIINFLQNHEYDSLMREAVCNSPSSLKSVLPDHIAARNPIGWKQLHHGVCMAGGNVSSFEVPNSVGGCFNGGKNIGTIDKPRWLPVPGGAHNCIRCRWFITSPFHLWALVAHFNVLMYHFDEARKDCIQREESLNALKFERLDCERQGIIFPKIKELNAHQRQWEAALQVFDDLAQDAGACADLAMRSRTALISNSSSGANSLIAVGDASDIDLAVAEVDSELMQLSGVCDVSEIYPDLNPGKAIFRRSQLLDAALYRDGYEPVFLRMTEQDQLLNGNEFFRKLSSMFDSADVSNGRRLAINLIDAEASLSKALGISIHTIVPEVKSIRIDKDLAAAKKGLQ